MKKKLDIKIILLIILIVIVAGVEFIRYGTTVDTK